jgi:hypothetical protein
VIVFALPMVFNFMLTGLVIGVAVGRKLSGKWSGGLALGLLLCLSPVVAAFLLFSLVPHGPR